MPGSFLIQTSQPAHVTPLGGAGSAVAASVLSLSGKYMELVVEQHIAGGTPVLAQARNWLMLGEVLYCANEQGRYHVRVRVEHALPSLKELTDMSRRFLDQTIRPPVAEAEGYSGWT